MLQLIQNQRSWIYYLGVYVFGGITYLILNVIDPFFLSAWEDKYFAIFIIGGFAFIIVCLFLAIVFGFPIWYLRERMHPNHPDNIYKEHITNTLDANMYKKTRPKTIFPLAYVAFLWACFLLGMMLLVLFL